MKTFTFTIDQEYTISGAEDLLSHLKHLEEQGIEDLGIFTPGTSVTHRGQVTLGIKEHPYELPPEGWGHVASNCYLSFLIHQNAAEEDTPEERLYCALEDLYYMEY
jgi:hypothetical protein